MISKSEQELSLFFNNSIFGAFFMMLDNPIEWNDQADKNKLIDYVIHHLRVTRVNQAFLEQYKAKENEMLGLTPFDFFEHDLDQEKLLLKNIFDHGKYRDISYEKKSDGTDVVFEGDYVVLYEENGPMNRITGVFGVQQDITKRVEHQKELETALKEKEILLAEIHHRIKNNLAIVSGLMQIQAFEAEEEVVKQKLTDSMFRVQTMATIHDIIYKNKDFSKLDFSIMLEKLIHTIKDVLLDGKEIEIHIKKETIFLNIKQAVPLALIVNELVTNIFKHAFRGKKEGCICVSIEQDDRQIHFTIEDNGVGFPKEMAFEKSDTLGLQMVKMLSQQLKGESSFINKSNGTKFNLKFTAV
jgi:PAS domain S-box-containing protein